MINIPKTRLYIGGIDSWYNLSTSGDWAVLHATQTIHYSLMGWDRRHNRPPKDHPNYIVYENNNRFSLNWVDGEARLYAWSGPETFSRALDFIDQRISRYNVLIHCDQGQSRAPTLGLLYLAKRTSIVSDESYAAAYGEFRKLYPSYAPGGIGQYVSAHWKEIA